MARSRGCCSKDGAAGWDLAIVGSGSAGFAAAIRARSLGAQVVMVERSTVGGTCVNRGCVPSKVLLRATEVYHQAARHPFPGALTRAERVDWTAMVAQKDALVERLRREKYTDLAREYGWEILPGEARFEAGPVLRVGEAALEARHYLVATGASPYLPPVPGLKESGYLTSTTAMELDALPRRLLVVGAGFVALELGQVFARLGTQVTMVRRGEGLLDHHEPEVGELMLEVLGDLGIEFLPRTRLLSVERESSTRRVRAQVLGVERTFEVDQILVAAGRRPNTAALALHTVGVETDGRGAIRVDASLRTANPRIWAAGDVVADQQFVYVAAAQGVRAAENALGIARPADLGPVPEVIFTHPQLAKVGLTEEGARRQGIEVESSLLPLSAVPRALVNHETRGFVKLVAERGTGKLLGAHVVAENAGDLIHTAALAIAHGLTLDDLASTLAPYLTMSEALRLAAQSFGKDVRKLSCCAS